MNTSISKWGMTLVAALAIAGCGGGGGGGGVVAPPPTGTAVNAAITAAAAVATNDSSTNTGSAFTVLQGAGEAAVTVNSPPVVKFTVFSDGGVVKGLTTANVRFAIAKLVPAAGGEPDQWVSYVTKTVLGKTSVNPSAMASAPQATTDTATAGQLVYNSDGYYTYTFTTDIKNVAGVTYQPTLTHRVAIQLSYKNAAGATVLANPYFDFTIGADGKSVPVTDPTKTRKMTDVASCNSCHDKLGLHGGGRVDTQYCVMCHNPGTIDPESGNNLTLSTMVHSIHSGKRLAAAGVDYVIWGYQDSKHDYAEVGFPQDLRNCTKCHSGSNPATPQGDNWKTAVSKQACLTCHNSKTGSVFQVKHDEMAVTGLAGPGKTTAADLTNADCVTCHKPGTPVAPETVHWNQNEENSVLYKMNIESVTVVSAPGNPVAPATTGSTGKVRIAYYLSNPKNGNLAYDLSEGCTGACTTSNKFGNLRFYVGYQNLVGQNTAVPEYTSYNNGGSGANAYAYAGTKDSNNHYTVDITIPGNTATAIAAGTARVISIGQVKEPKLALKASDPLNRPPVVPAAVESVVVQNSFMEFDITGAATFTPRRTIVSSAKCNVCHGSLGSTSGSNTLANAFHGGARDTVESCAICHDVNRASSGNMMTNGLALYESYQMKNMIHGIHGNSKRATPFTHGNPVVGTFDMTGKLLSAGTWGDDKSASYYNAGSSGATTTMYQVLTKGGAVPANETFQTIATLLANAARNDPRASGKTISSTFSAAENYGAEVAWPGVGVNCNACHEDNSYKQDRSPVSTLALKPVTTAGSTTAAPVYGTDPNAWLVLSPKAATCTGCHNGLTKGGASVIGHVTASFAGSTFGTATRTAVAALPRESCDDCHAPGAVKGVDIVHGQK